MGLTSGAEDRDAVDLPEGVAAMRIAELSRGAALTFANGAKGWSKRDLGQWLAGPYREVTAFAAGDHRPPSRPPSSRKMRAAGRIAAAEKVESLLENAREAVLATLMMLIPPTNDPSFRRAISADHVVRSRDRIGRAGWAPVDAPGMSLTDRVLSLVAVDYLMRPADYLGLLCVCGACHTISFDAQARVRGHCREAR